MDCVVSTVTNLLRQIRKVLTFNSLVAITAELSIRVTLHPAQPLGNQDATK